MDVHVMRHRAQSMRWIQISVALHVRYPPPQAFALTRSHNAAQIVEISRLAVCNLSEKSIVYHPQHRQLSRSVAATLENHAVLARGRGTIPHRPASLRCRAGRVRAAQTELRSSWRSWFSV